MYTIGPGRFERFFLILSFLLLSGAFFSTARVLRQANIPIGDQDLWNTTSNFLVYTISLALLVANFARVRHVLSSIWQIPVICIYVMLSIIWSDAPEISARRVVALILGILFAYYIAGRFTIPTIIHSLSRSFMIIAVSCYAAILILPETAIMDLTFDYSWRGVYPHKNVLGQAAVFAMLTHAYVALAQRRERLSQTIFIVLWGYLLLRSWSITAMIVTFALLVSAVPLLTFKFRERYYVAALYVVSLVFLSAGIILYLNIEDVFSAMDKDITLTGRTELWSFLFPVINDRLLFGYGFGGFWHADNPQAAFIWETLGWQQNQAHNGLLDLLLQIGIVGTALVAWLIARTFVSSVYLLRRGDFAGADFSCFIIVFLMTNSITEYMFLRSNDIYWILFTIFAVAVADASRRAYMKASIGDRGAMASGG